MKEVSNGKEMGETRTLECMGHLCIFISVLSVFHWFLV